jgi:hypothetical protein
MARFRCMLLHWGNAPIDWVEYLTNLWPNALRLRDNRGFLPVHVGAENDASLDVIYCLTILKPDTLRSPVPVGYI